MLQCHANMTNCLLLWSKICLTTHLTNVPQMMFYSLNEVPFHAIVSKLLIRKSFVKFVAVCLEGRDFRMLLKHHSCRNSCCKIIIKTLI